MTTGQRTTRGTQFPVRNGGVSHWWTQIGLPEQRPGLDGDLDVDVAIVGGGFTGLWTAYYLKRADPGLRVAVIEQRFAGYGASGRNGGWCVNSITAGRDRLLRDHPRDEVERFQRAMNDTVDEVVRVARAEGIDADIVRSGEFTVANVPAEEPRLHAFAASEQQWKSSDLVLLEAAEARERINVAGTRVATWQPHSACVQPAKLVRGLAETVDGLGVRILEGTRATRIAPRRVETDRGVVRAEYVVRATEGFTAEIAGLHRRWLPLNSSMIVTEPLGADVWDEIGWAGREVLGDSAHVYMYAQRTADNRIAFGGRGKPYRYGSRIDTDGITPQETVDAIAALLHRFFPATREARIDHAWSGVLGVPRDWAASVGLDRRTGLAWAGGYVGTGVATTNLAGRTIADLIRGERSDLVTLPWVDHRARNWEPEPLRWLGTTGVYALYGAADRAELRHQTARTSTLARAPDLVSGH